jgi:hypothetical protein
VAGLGEETVVSVRATLVANPAAPGGVELVDPVVELLTEPSHPPPVELWRPTLNAGLPTLLDHAPVTLRHPRTKAAWQIASASMHGFRQTLTAQGFTEIQTPKLVGTSTGVGGERGHSRRAVTARSRTPATSRRSGTACLPTEASRSGWSAGWPGSSARRTSVRCGCSPAT